MPKGDPRFHKVVEDIAWLHDKKQADYGSGNDPYANVRASQAWGLDPWVGALVRLSDKVHRLQQFAEKKALSNESAEDSMLDIAVYAIIALVLYREQGQSPWETQLELEQLTEGPPKGGHEGGGCCGQVCKRGVHIWDDLGAGQVNPDQLQFVFS